MFGVSSVLGRIAIAYKIAGLVALLLVFLAGISIVAVGGMQRVGTQLDVVAEEGLPLSDLTSEMEFLQASRAAQVQRAMRYGSALAIDGNPDSRDRMESAIERFDEHSARIGELHAAAVEYLERLLAQGGATAARWEEAHADFMAIDMPRQAYDSSAETFFEQLHNGQAIAARQMLESLQMGEDRLTARIHNLAGLIRERVEAAAEEAARAEQQVLSLVSVIALVGGALSVVLAWILVRAITRPLVLVVNALERLGEGDTSQRVPVVGRDEVARLASAYEIFREQLIAAEEARQRQAQLEAEEEEKARQALLALADRFEERVGSVVEGVNGAATRMQATAEELSAAVEETTAQSGAVSAAAEQASTNVQTVASATEELSAAIREVSGQVADTASKSRRTAEGAQAVRGEMDGLAAAIQQVDAIIEAISDIAEQTNLLALNATIESARAGEAGKGFAVVANEVKELATHTKQMTDDIGQKINAVKASADNAVQAMQQIIAQVGAIDEATATMASSVEQQTAATNEISRNAQEASSGASEVSSNIVSVQTAASQSGQATNNVRAASSELASQAETLKKELDALLAEIRAA